MAVSRYRFPFLLSGKGHAMPMEILLHGTSTLYWCIGIGLRFGGLRLLSRYHVVDTISLHLLSVPSVLLSDLFKVFDDQMPS